MKAIASSLPGLILIEFPIFKDDRGFFAERFHEGKIAQLGIQEKFVQDNHSWSKPGVLRGLHYQTNPPQGKLVGAITGRILDVAVDLRKNSPTLGKYYSTELSAENGRMLWIPYGFAHGFYVLGDEPADVIYKVTGLYNPKTERGIRWDDAELAIHWPSKAPLVSNRDQILPRFKEIEPL